MVGDIQSGVFGDRYAVLSFCNHHCIWRRGGGTVIYTPHGISPTDLELVAKAEPRIQTLCLLHGLHDIKLGAQLNMGAHNGLKVQRLLRAKYWIGTHDEIKKGGGF